MNRLFFAAFSLGVLMVSCKETPPPINYGGAVVVDTTYEDAANIPAAEPHEVLVEEFTGQSCTNCPAAHESLEKIREEHNNHVNVIGLYYEGISQTKPPTGAKYDLRQAAAKETANTVYGGVNSIPAAGVERFAPSGSGIKLAPAEWENAITTRLAVPTPVNIKIDSRYNATDRIDSVKITLTYTGTVSYKHNMCIAVLEDSIIDKQEYPSTHPIYPGENPNYVFKNVFRSMVNGTISGDAVLPAMPVKNPGRVIVRNYTYKVPENHNPDHCHLVAYIIKTEETAADKGIIIHSRQAKMK